MPKVLVVDDSLSVRKVVERALGTKQIDVLSAASGQEAVEQIGREEPDLVVSDVIMPDMDGYQICQFVKTHPRLARTPVLLMSGIVDDSVLDRAAVVRSDDVMRKPFTTDELLAKVVGLLKPSAAPVCTMGNIAEASGVVVARPPESPACLSAHEVPAPEAAEPADLKAILGKLAALPGVALSVLVDRDGFLIESAGDVALETEVAAALASCLAESSEGIGRELGQGKFQSMILEYEYGVVVMSSVDPTAMLAVLLRDPAVLGKVRYYVKRLVPALLGAL
jgi:CheY-like chemotaxis protein